MCGARRHSAYINIINCEYVHIYDRSAFVYAADNVWVLDEITTLLIAIVKATSIYNAVASKLEERLKLEHQTAINLINDIIRVNHRFLSISDSPNNIMITGQWQLRFPAMLQISLTNRCVHQCLHCFKNCGFATKEDLPLGALRRVLNQVKTECRFIEFTGGEPLLYPDIMDVVGHIYRQFRVRITTSGYLLRKFNLSDLKKFDMIQISLHGSTAAIHDSFVCKQGSFRVVTENIQWLCENGVNVVVSRSFPSYDENELNDFIRLCVSLGVRRVVVGIILPAGRAMKTQCATSQSDGEKISAFLRRAQEEYPQISIALDDEHTLSGKYSKYVFHCIGGRLHLYVGEDGNVFPCPYCQGVAVSMGNIVSEPSLIDKIVYQSYYDTFNEKLLKLPISHLGGVCPNIRKPDA